jgi:2,3-bisphosphoglycerate-independent phosphoglycerate mutase
MKQKGILAQVILALLALTCQLGQCADNDSIATGAVILVIDGLGSSYFYPEYSPYALDGALLDKAALFNLTGPGLARVLDVRVPIPETTTSHGVLISGDAGADPFSLERTLFEVSRENSFLCLGILERGDSISLLQKLDSAIYLDDNSICGAEPVPGSRSGLPPDLKERLEAWQHNFSTYTSADGIEAYKRYNLWAIDAASDMVKEMGKRPFVMLVNAGAVDSAGQDLDPESYVKVISDLDRPLGRLADVCRQNKVLLVVTADHGMTFRNAEARGGHASGDLSKSLESLRTPVIFLGPGVDDINLGGIWSEEDISPAILAMLGIPDWEMPGVAMPIMRSCSLFVLSGPGNVTLLRGGELITESGDDGEHIFRGLEMGNYIIEANNGRSRSEVCLTGYESLDMRPEVWQGLDLKMVLGPILILAINLAGSLVIWRIIKRRPSCIEAEVRG